MLTRTAGSTAIQKYLRRFNTVLPELITTLPLRFYGGQIGMINYSDVGPAICSVNDGRSKTIKPSDCDDGAC